MKGRKLCREPPPPETPQGGGRCRGGWAQDGWALTAGYNLALEVVPRQVKDPEDSVVQKDQEEHKEEVTGEVKRPQHIENLLPSGQEDGA